MYKIIIIIFCYMIVATIMMTIGNMQIKKKTPVAFYSNERELSVDEITNVKKWNRMHGMMWMISCIAIIPFWTVGYLMPYSIWTTVPFIGGIVIPFFVMAKCHRWMIKKYKSKSDGYGC